MSLLLVTGLSGSGKSVVVNALEDIGYFCVDNIPSTLISKFVEFYQHAESTLDKIAMVADIRGNSSASELETLIEGITGDDVDCKILFLDARDSVLERRYKETRRRHPISIKNDVPIEKALQIEREILAPLYEKADYIIDTSVLSTAQVKDRIVTLFTSSNELPMALNVMSFGFKFGLPKEADLVFDVRCVPNPYYVPQLKEKTGLEPAVEEFVFSHKEAKKLFEHLSTLLKYSLPLYMKEGKSQLTIAIGCTGGKHRSVAFAQRIAMLCEGLGFSPQIQHRDIARFN